MILDIIVIGVLTLTIIEKQCKYPNTVEYNKEIDQQAASIRVELMMIKSGITSSGSNSYTQDLIEF